jgi:hypothetical protein
VIRTVVAVVTCALLAACTAAGDVTPSSAATPAPTTATPAPATAVLPCADQIGTDAPAAPFETVLGVVALPASPGYQALQTSRTGDSGPQRLFAKTGLVIRAGTTFDLVVPGGTTLGIGWGSAPTTPSRRLHVPACPSAGGAGWLAYAGGYWTDRPACVALIVVAGGRQQQVRIGLGTPCPGQRPPAQPSER